MNLEDYGLAIEVYFKPSMEKRLVSDFKELKNEDLDDKHSYVCIRYNNETGLEISKKGENIRVGYGRLYNQRVLLKIPEPYPENIFSYIRPFIVSEFEKEEKKTLQALQKLSKIKEMLAGIE